MFSVMYTGMNMLPLCTASVWPTNSGEMVQRRAHVFITRFSFDRFMASTFFRSFASTYGPFLTERLIGFVSLPARQLLRPPAHDQFVGQLGLPRLLALREEAPRRTRVTAARRLAFAAAHRVVDGIH